MAAHHSNNGSPVAAVAYYRMSSDKQETSIPAQREAVEQYAERHGYRIIREYLDEGISGDATEKRLGFQRMIADASKGDFSAILCWDQDRFGRFDSVEAGHWIYPLRQASVKLVSVSDGPVDWNDFTGRVIYNIKQEGKHLFLRDLSRNVLRGKLAAAKRGEWMGRAPFGYRVENKKLKLGPSREVETVRRIFRTYLDGLSIRGVCIALNNEGIKSQTGTEWSPKVVKHVLSNQTYTGTYVWNATHQGKYHAVLGGEVVAEFRKGSSDDSERIVFKSHFQGIIDQQTFDTVQQRLRQRRTKTTPHRNGGKYLFTGILRCGKCGSRMHGSTCSGRARYQCSRFGHKGVCDLNAVKQDQLLDVVLGTVEREFLKPEKLELLRAELRRQVELKASEADPVRLRKELGVVESKLTKAKLRLVEVDADMVGLVQEQIRTLRQEQERLTAVLRTAETPKNRLHADCERTVEKAVAMLSGLHGLLQNADPVKLREFCQRAFERIEVWCRRDPYHGQRPFRLHRGVIYLNSEILPNNLLPSS